MHITSLMQAKIVLMIRRLPIESASPNLLLILLNLK